ncbi:2-oxoglutarate dehydrogenase E2 component [Sulfobacillus thermosulfidooxidans DSM 9293]|uniref:Dihydrolipoyllysine-residue succinyltransferase component of 2-oxoglutarate dehydrogenase complex n=1 Tax=Sulfobacillus thermosulfidooxidans (strain DSM 9293 / VKM B-1269 / AT-1) TaxID=929705 RepID=A0A1W1WGG0_SULTA|nr:2-oxoglutarate dehydrogenase complex dihydrolipoyllysine-residue succinyltransferase [Sulfobacillus thermosulfidooxidans]SMC05391.1 2-oxoglutarate dehydrogenase E2 component [Sulfobacillus thermosulfidooxidans DSM 9293]
MTQITVPEVGESVTEATVGEWLKKPGDLVKAGDPIVELETDKVNLEITANEDGTLHEILKQSGETVVVGDVLATLVSGDSAATTPAETSQASTSAVSNDQPANPVQEAPVVRATPDVRRLADQEGINLSEVPTQGNRGRVTHTDVEAYIQQTREKAPVQPQFAPEAPQAPQSPEMPPLSSSPTQVTTSPAATDDLRPVERVKMSRRRLTIANRLVNAQHTAAMLTTFNEVDMTKILDIRQRRRDEFEKRHGIRLGFMSFFTKASIAALKAFPRLNAEIEGDEMILKHYYDIGIAVSTDNGLVVPVVRNADRLNFAGLEKAIAELAIKARDNKLSIADLQGGTFTITNGGVFGSLLSTPILNAPQVAILGMHKIEERPVVVQGQIVVRPMMYLALSYDHRIVDGSEAVRFLVLIKELLEDPEALLLEG